MLLLQCEFLSSFVGVLITYNIYSYVQNYKLMTTTTTTMLPTKKKKIRVAWETTWLELENHKIPWCVCTGGCHRCLLIHICILMLALSLSLFRLGISDWISNVCSNTHTYYLRATCQQSKHYWCKDNCYIMLYTKREQQSFSLFFSHPSKQAKKEIYQKVKCAALCLKNYLLLCINIYEKNEIYEPRVPCRYM